jgi:hypothetical protein
VPTVFHIGPILKNLLLSEGRWSVEYWLIHGYECDNDK